MTNRAKAEGDEAEREVAALINDLLGINCRRALGAGRKDDVGDVYGVPHTVIQVTRIRDFTRAIREKLAKTEAQRKNAGATFAALWVRLYGKRYVVVMTPEQWATYHREAMS